MFDFVHNNRRLANAALAFVSLGLLLGGGMAGFELLGRDDFLAKVGKVRITQRDFYEITHGQEVPDSAKPQVIEELVKRQLIRNEADQRYLEAGPAQLREAIMAIPEFKKDGQFDPDTYRTLLAANQLTPVDFERRISDKIRESNLLGVIGDTSIISKATSSRVLALFTDTRSVRVATFDPEKYLDRVSVSDADIKKFYDAHLADYKIPERVKLQYVVLSQDALAATAPVDEARVKSYFDAHQAQLAQEQRHLRHILIAADAKAPAADRAKAKAKAESILEQLKKDPKRFAELAKAESQDPGSAAQGGDLGMVSRGTMVKPFEEASFKLSKGELSPVVETQFGYHIITVDEIKMRGFEDARADIEAQLRKEYATQQFANVSQKFQDLVYQNADSLDAAIKELKLTPANSDWVTRTDAVEPMLNDQKLRDAVFSDDVLKKHHNTEPVDIKTGTQISARVIAHEDARTRSLDEVKAAVTQKLRLDAATVMSDAEGKKALAALQKGEAVQVSWADAKQVSRLKPEGLDAKAVEAVFALPAAKLPGYAGVASGNHYLLLKAEAGKAEAPDPAMQNNVMQAISRTQAEMATQAYLNSLKVKNKVVIHP